MPAVETQYWLTRFCFQRALAFIYLIGFLIALNQAKGLIGSNGLLPVKNFIPNVRFIDSPSLFFINHSDTALVGVALLGVTLSLFALSGLSESFGLWVSIATWFSLWALYLSFVNVGQTFYGFGWEILLLETGFLAIFLGSKDVATPVVVIWLLRWVLFRIMFGAGLIKLRGDACWTDLTCMFYHYETQPLPNPLSWYFHQLPKWAHKLEVLFTHFVEVIVPFGLFGPRPLRHVAGIITVVFQVSLIVSGNLSWLNYLTLVLCISCFDDTLLSKFLPITPIATVSVTPYNWASYFLAGLVTFLSIKPTLNLISNRQIMNTSFDPLHLVNTYGAFGSITKKRMEVVFEGTDDIALTKYTIWKEYEFKGKPGSTSRRPCLVSPYHYKLDWQMWFAAMTTYSQHPWILNLTAKLLQNTPEVISLMQHNPFPEKPPQYVRALWYEYEFTTFQDGTKEWWRRKLVDEYLPPLSLENVSFQQILQSEGWY